MAPAASPELAIERVGDTATGSTVVLGKVGGRTLAFVADEDSHAVHEVDAATMQEVGKVSVGGRPAQMLVTKRGQLWVALRDAARISVLAAHADETLTEQGSVATAVEPIALAPTADDAAVLVASGWGHALQRFDQKTFERSLEVDLPREPRAVIASKDGAKAFVSHSGSGALSTVSLSDAKVASLDLGNPAGAFSGITMSMPPPPDMRRPMDGLVQPPPKQAIGMRRRPISKSAFDEFESVKPATFARQSFALARMMLASGKGEESRVLVPHSDMMTGDPTVISSGYGGGGVEADMKAEQFSVASISETTGARTGTPNNELSTAHACSLPRAAATVQGTLVVVCMGSDEINVYRMAPGPTFQKSVKVPAGPTGIAIDPATMTAYVYSLFDATLTRVSSEALAPESVSTAVAHDGPKKPAVEVPARQLAQVKLDRANALSAIAERGRRIFHAGTDERISSDGRSCASCHPDGRDDGLVWSTPNGPRQTISLAGRIRHEAPFGWMAKHASLQEHMRMTMKNLKGKGLPPEEEDALAAYLLAMPGPPSAPTGARATSALTAQEQQGKAIYESSKAECAVCHGGKDKSDHETHDVKSKTASDRTHDFIAPSLVGISGSAPYFHDGRYASLEDLLDKSEGKMATTSSLTPPERAALLSYLRTL